MEDLPAVLQAGPRVIYTAGRPPWFDSSGQMKEAFVIGICGGSGSGKTTVAKRIITALDLRWISHLSMDSFYKNLTKEQSDAARRNEYNFDSPDALDFADCVKKLKLLKQGKRVLIPIYNFVKHCRDKAQKTLYGANVVILEGILIYFYPELRDLIDLKVFVDTDIDVCLSRRLLRDTSDRGRTIDNILNQYVKYVKPAFDHYVLPTMSIADVIIPGDAHNEPAIDLIVKHVQRELHQVIYFVCSCSNFLPDKPIIELK
ncbi:hypothetical protein GJ496_005093 [Pomphorhynchus laevis]|nr:hypothetical protein GJ496_005093 [Pomphorhynchus laevis]